MAHNYKPRVHFVRGTRDTLAGARVWCGKTRDSVVSFSMPLDGTETIESALKSVTCIGCLKELGRFAAALKRTKGA